MLEQCSMRYLQSNMPYSYSDGAAYLQKPVRKMGNSLHHLSIRCWMLYRKISDSRDVFYTLVSPAWRRGTAWRSTFEFWCKRIDGRKRSSELGHGFPKEAALGDFMVGVETTAPVAKVNKKYMELLTCSANQKKNDMKYRVAVEKLK